MKSFFARILLLVQALPASAFAANSVVNLSHYDFVRPDFVGMKNEGVVGVIHEATYPRFERDAKYYDRQVAGGDPLSTQPAKEITKLISRSRRQS